MRTLHHKVKVFQRVLTYKARKCFRKNFTCSPMFVRWLLQACDLVTLGVIWPLEGLPRSIHWISNCMPVTYAVMAVKAVISKGTLVYIQHSVYCNMSFCALYRHGDRWQTSIRGYTDHTGMVGLLLVLSDSYFSTITTSVWHLCIVVITT